MTADGTHHLVGPALLGGGNLQTELVVTSNLCLTNGDSHILAVNGIVSDALQCHHPVDVLGDHVGSSDLGILYSHGLAVLHHESSIGYELSQLVEDAHLTGPVGSNGLTHLSGSGLLARCVVNQGCARSVGNIYILSSRLGNHQSLAGVTERSTVLQSVQLGEGSGTLHGGECLLGHLALVSVLHGNGLHGRGGVDSKRLGVGSALSSRSSTVGGVVDSSTLGSTGDGHVGSSQERSLTGDDGLSNGGSLARQRHHNLLNAAITCSATNGERHSVLAASPCVGFEGTLVGGNLVSAVTATKGKHCLGDSLV